MPCIQATLFFFVEIAEVGYYCMACAFQSDLFAESIQGLNHSGAAGLSGNLKELISVETKKKTIFLIFKNIPPVHLVLPSL